MYHSSSCNLIGNFKKLQCMQCKSTRSRLNHELLLITQKMNCGKLDEINSNIKDGRAKINGTSKAIDFDLLDGKL